MLKEFVEAISGLAVRATEPRILRDAADPRKAYVVANGQLQETTVQPPLLASPVETFESLFDAIKMFGGEQASVWHDRHCVVAMLDNADRLEEVRLALRVSEQFKALASLPKAFDQRALILFLKRNLAGAVDDTLISIFRKLDFQKREEGGATIKHGDESLGRGIHAAVTGSAEIPEFLTATIVVYSNPEIRFSVTVRLSVDIDVQRCVIELTPLPDEIERAILATQEYINSTLLDLAPQHVAIFNGTPAFDEMDQSAR